MVAGGRIDGGKATGPVAGAAAVGRPLAGRRVLVTRSRAQAEDMLRALENLGAEPVALPLLEIQPPEDPAPLEQAVARLATYQWVIFTSANAARAVAAVLAARGRDGRACGEARVCAVGPATAAALRDAGFPVHLVPEEHVGEGVVAALQAQGPLAGLRVLLPRAAAARDLVPEELRRRGAVVDVVTAYRTVRPAASERTLERLRRGEIPIVTFASPSAVHALVELLGGDAAAAAVLGGVTIAVIGPKTRDAVLAHGLQASVMPAAYTVPALIDALCAHLHQGGR